MGGNIFQGGGGGRVSLHIIVMSGWGGGVEIIIFFLMRGGYDPLGNHCTVSKYESHFHISLFGITCYSIECNV